MATVHSRSSGEEWDDAQVAAVYGIQGTLRDTAELLDLSHETVRQVLKRQGIDTDNPDRGGARVEAPKPRPAPRPCVRCGVEIPYNERHGLRRYGQLLYCSQACGTRASGDVRRRISDTELLAAVRELRSLTAVAARLGMTNLNVRSRLGTILFRRLIGDAGVASLDLEAQCPEMEAKDGDSGRSI